MNTDWNTNSISSGIPRLDQILGGLLIGDNVLWYDDSGNLAAAYYHRFIQESLAEKKPVIFVSFDRSLKNLFDRLGAMARDENLIVLDCFSHGKGKGIATFMKFLKDLPRPARDKVVCVEDPNNPDRFSEALYTLHGGLAGDVRLVFESLTGMQDVWGGEDAVLSFYTRSCPHLYELNTVAYWVLEKAAHSQRLRAHINQIAQVALELAVKRGTTTLKVIKAEGREPIRVQQPHRYQTRGETILFEGDRAEGTPEALGARIKQLRIKRGMSQAELAKQVGVTPSTISQVESNAIFPSIPGLLKMAEVLSVEAGYFFGGDQARQGQVVFPETQAASVRLENLAAHGASAKLLTPMDHDGKARPHLIEIPPQAVIPGHFLAHKGNELGYVLEGRLRIGFDETAHGAGRGDLIYLGNHAPREWANLEDKTARLLWIVVE
jgi:transcriptional regulator with XRE-family HTH domain/KaiC/GvpD/RAD55 family RecA-like ATPase